MGKIPAELTNSSPKTHPWLHILFISSLIKAAYKFFNYFAPWTAIVQGPLLNSCVMNVIMTIVNDRPVRGRTLPRRTLLPLVAQASSPAGCGGVSPPPNSEPNFKFRELFRRPPVPGWSLEKCTSAYK